MCMQKIFSEDIKKVALRNNGVSTFTEHKLNGGEYKVLIPSEWSIEETRASIDEKELEVKFNSDKIEGNITILNNINSIDETHENMFKHVKNKKNYKYESNGVSWNVIDYEVKDNTNSFSNKCYFREYSEGKAILINFKYDNSKFKPSMEVVFEKIVDGFRQCN